MRGIQAPCAVALAFAAALVLGLLGQVKPRQGKSGGEAAAQAKPCSSPEFQQFNFWVGNWDVFEVGTQASQPVAHAIIEPILDGCVLLEDYRQSDSRHGESFTIYESSRGVWHQTWVTNAGQLLVIEGKFANGEMVLSGIDHAKNGQLVRGRWRAVAGGVRETAERSSDGGATWTQWFDLTFRPHQQ